MEYRILFHYRNNETIENSKEYRFVDLFVYKIEPS